MAIYVATNHGPMRITVSFLVGDTFSSNLAGPRGAAPQDAMTPLATRWGSRVLTAFGRAGFPNEGYRLEPCRHLSVETDLDPENWRSVGSSADAACMLAVFHEAIRLALDYIQPVSSPVTDLFKTVPSLVASGTVGISGTIGTVGGLDDKLRAIARWHDETPEALQGNGGSPGWLILPSS